MTTGNPVSRVVDHLAMHGYRPLPTPLMISGMQFTFPAVLVGPENTSDLVLVADTAETDDNDTIVRKVLGVGRALDIARKTNPLTTIIVGPRPTQSTISDMMSACRVLPIGSVITEEADAAVSNWLAVLTPLVAHEDSIVVDPLSELQDEISNLRPDILAVTESAKMGANAVEAAINTIILKDLEEGLEEEL